jgi:hypothetical protein
VKCLVCDKETPEGSTHCGADCLESWLRVSGASEEDIQKALKSGVGKGVWVKVAAEETERVQ